MRDTKSVKSKLPVEKPHPESAVEWWFFHGFFEGKNIGKRFFMVTFFRHNQPESTKDKPPGLAVVYSILNPETGENFTRSQIDETVRKRYIELLKEKSNLEMDPDFYRILIKELEMHGPARPVLLKEVSADLTGQTPDVTWDEFSLQQKIDHFEITIPLLEDEKSCTLQLTPQTELFEFNSTEGAEPIEDDMMYRCYPKIEVTGTAGSEGVAGQAWMDHQWGNSSWLISREENDKILGWDWFGINLDDGTDLIVFILKYAKTNATLHTLAVDLKNGRGPVFLSGLHAEPLDFWQCPRTRISYPVKWKIDITGIDLSLIFEATVKNQEIPVTGMARSLWEGIGVVTGTMAGREISGMARAEFYGYGYIFDFQKYLNTLADIVDKRLEEFLPKEMTEGDIQKFVGLPHWINEPEAYTEMISKPAWDMILRRGKRWRPIFGIWMQESLGKSSANYELGICLSELIHTGSLIIDDIQDQSELRRGRPSLYRTYGIDVAINAGNTLYFLPFVELMNHKHMTAEQKLQIYQIMNETHLKAHFGQTLDIYWSKNMNPENLSKWLNDDIEAKILQMYDYKTAAGPKGIAEVAAVLAESDEKVKNAAVDFARSFAVGFQLIDDILNFSSSDKWSKVCGEDISSGKLTYVIAKAIKKLEPQKSNRLKEILCDEALRREKPTLDEAVELVRKSGALEESKTEARKMSSEAWDRFAELVPNSEPKILLNMLHLKMIDLAYDT
jgi:geranylgeranyl pyrophosphate synthase/predicted secreted hydrolase